LDGNQTSDGRWNYTWDAENRLIRLVANTATGPQQRLDFEYDYQGRRIGKKVWNNTGGTGTPATYLKFAYDGWNQIAELDGNNASPCRFTSKYTDDEMDFVYYGFRYYNASTGRWLSRDPLEEQIEQGLYAFVGNDSVNGCDLVGLLNVVRLGFKGAGGTEGEWLRGLESEQRF